MKLVITGRREKEILKQIIDDNKDNDEMLSAILSDYEEATTPSELKEKMSKYYTVE